MGHPVNRNNQFSFLCWTTSHQPSTDYFPITVCSIAFYSLHNLWMTKNHTVTTFITLLNGCPNVHSNEASGNAMIVGLSGVATI